MIYNLSVTQLSSLFVTVFILSCAEKKQLIENTNRFESQDTSSNFKADIDFLKQYTDIIVLRDSSGKSKVAVSPALQGRVMTSTSEGDNGLSYGWINRQALLSGDTSSHMNAFGGEDRFWLGPEGGQYALYFEKGKDFTFDNWHVPRFIDLDPFNTISSSAGEAVFTKEATLENYSGTVFNIGIKRKVRLIPEKEALQILNAHDTNGASLIAYETINTLNNKGQNEWKKETGLLSIWILGMYNPSENITVIIPHNGKNKSPKEIVNTNYFGPVPDDRLKIDDKVVYFRCDGKYRSKIGLPPAMAREWMGSYDADNGVLTLVKYNKPEGATDYVNASWQIQNEPYHGDVVNAYNDGPPAPGARPMGPFYELESSSPGAALKPGDSILHRHSSFHIKGTSDQLDPIMLKVLGVTTAQVSAVFK
jgi:hypothetical protein